MTGHDGPKYAVVLGTAQYQSALDDADPALETGNESVYDSF